MYTHVYTHIYSKNCVRIYIYIYSIVNVVYSHLAQDKGGPSKGG